jgi:hypothetical protein
MKMSLFTYQSLRLFFVCVLSLLSAQSMYGQDANVSASTIETVLPNKGLAPDTSASSSNSTLRVMAAPVNDNFASATALAVNGGFQFGTNFQGSLEAGENLDCNSSAVSTVWYSFPAGLNTTLYVNINSSFGAFFTGAAVWNTTTLPTGNCQAMQCQDNEAAGLSTYSMELTNLTNTTYYVQVTYPSTLNNITNFEISVSTVPAYTVFNPPPVNTCATAVPGCYINSFNPSVATIEASCPGYQFQKPPYPTNVGFPNGGLKNGYVYSMCWSFTNLNTSDS